MNLRGILGEYFFGTETIKFYKGLRAFNREFILGKETLIRSLQDAYLSEAIYLAIGKIIPNILTGMALYDYLKNKNPPNEAIFDLIFPVIYLSLFLHI